MYFLTLFVICKEKKYYQGLFIIFPCYNCKQFSLLPNPDTGGHHGFFKVQNGVMPRCAFFPFPPSHTSHFISIKHKIKKYS